MLNNIKMNQSKTNIDDSSITYFDKKTTHYLNHNVMTNGSFETEYDDSTQELMLGNSYDVSKEQELISFFEFENPDVKVILPSTRRSYKAQMVSSYGFISTNPIIQEGAWGNTDWASYISMTAYPQIFRMYHINSRRAENSGLLSKEKQAFYEAQMKLNPVRIKARLLLNNVLTGGGKIFGNTSTDFASIEATETFNFNILLDLKQMLDKNGIEVKEDTVRVGVSPGTFTAIYNDPIVKEVMKIHKERDMLINNDKRLDIYGITIFELKMAPTYKKNKYNPILGTKNTKTDLSTALIFLPDPYDSTFKNVIETGDGKSNDLEMINHDYGSSGMFSDFYSEFKGYGLEMKCGVNLIQPLRVVAYYFANESKMGTGATSYINLVNEDIMSFNVIDYNSDELNDLKGTMGTPRVVGSSIFVMGSIPKLDDLEKTMGSAITSNIAYIAYDPTKNTLDSEGNATVKNVVAQATYDTGGIEQELKVPNGTYNVELVYIENSNLMPTDQGVKETPIATEVDVVVGGAIGASQPIQAETQPTQAETQPTQEEKLFPLDQ